MSWIDARPLALRLREGAADTLSDAELLALVLHPADPDAAVPTIRQHLQTLGGLPGLSRATHATLAPVLGDAAATQWLAAVAWSQRQRRDAARPLQFTDAAAVAAYLQPRLMDLPHEAAAILLLDRQNQLLHEQILTQGGTHATIIEPKQVFRLAVTHLAHGIILAHNHPSGTLEPSEADRTITAQLRAGARTLDLVLLDHLIISYRGYYSFAEQGLL